MFYDQYEKLCLKVNKRPYTVAREIGLGTSNVAQWKKGSTPRPDVLKQLAEYFNVTQAELLDLDQKNKPTLISESELDASLINLLADLTPEEIDRVDAFVQGLKANRKV